VIRVCWSVASSPFAQQPNGSSDSTLKVRESWQRRERREVLGVLGDAMGRPRCIEVSEPSAFQTAGCPQRLVQASLWVGYLVGGFGGQRKFRTSVWITGGAPQGTFIE
jgi:hypothetical protein